MNPNENGQIPIELKFQFQSIANTIDGLGLPPDKERELTMKVVELTQQTIKSAYAKGFSEGIKAFKREAIRHGKS